MSNFKDLVVWQKARAFIKKMYDMTALFPSSEVYGITSQLRRASISIANNIVEGSTRPSTKEFNRFLDIAFGSAVEVENLLYISFDLSFVDSDQLETCLEDNIELQRMIKGLSKAITTKPT